MTYDKILYMWPRLVTQLTLSYTNTKTVLACARRGRKLGDKPIRLMRVHVSTNPEPRARNSKSYNQVQARGPLYGGYESANPSWIMHRKFQGEGLHPGPAADNTANQSEQNTRFRV